MEYIWSGNTIQLKSVCDIEKEEGHVYDEVVDDKVFVNAHIFYSDDDRKFVEVRALIDPDTYMITKTLPCNFIRICHGDLCCLKRDASKYTLSILAYLQEALDVKFLDKEAYGWTW